MMTRYTPKDIDTVRRILLDADLPSDTMVEFYGTARDGVKTVADLLLIHRWPDGFALVVNKDPDPRFCLVTVEPV
jgi:hypothetical protein